MAKAVFLRRYRVVPRTGPIEVKRVLVVGGAGYLGSVLIPLLLKRGYQTRVLDSLIFGDESLKPALNHPDFELIRGDVRDIEAIVQATQGCQAVIHLAAIVGDPACEENRKLAVEVNRAATRMLIDVARGYGIQRFLFASTCSVYGASEFLMDEYSSLNPLSTYAQTKLDSERLLLSSKNREFHPTVLRLATLFGLSPRPRFDLVVNLLTARAAMTGKITIFNGEQWRPLLHVEDAAHAFVLCLKANLDVVSGEIFNVGSYALNRRLSEVGQVIARIVPTVEIEHVENHDHRNYRVSFDKIHTLLGFRCEKSLEEGVNEIYESARSGQIGDLGAPQFNNQAALKHFASTIEAEHSSLRFLETLAGVE